MDGTLENALIEYADELLGHSREGTNPIHFLAYEVSLRVRKFAALARVSAESPYEVVARGSLEHHGDGSSHFVPPPVLQNGDSLVGGFDWYEVHRARVEPPIIGSTFLPPDAPEPPSGTLIGGIRVSAEPTEDTLAEALKRATYLAENLHGMIDRETWRATGGDDGQGHYEGDYRAEQVADEIKALRVLASRGVSAENKETS